MTSPALTLRSSVALATGHSIPLLGFGVYQNYDARPSVVEALNAGYRLIDTAQAYRNEAHVAQAIQESSVPRADIFITTKVAPKVQGYENTLKSVDESLQKLGTDYIDLLLLHDPFGGPQARRERYEALLEAQKQGKIRSVGVSNFGVPHLQQLAEANLPLPAVNQIEIHPLCQQRDIVQYCTERSIILEAYCPIIRGKMDHETITSLASKYNKDPAQILLRWSLQKGFVPLPKSATPSRIQSNAQLYDFELSPEDMARLDALDQGKKGAISWNPVDADADAD